MAIILSFHWSTRQKLSQNDAIRKPTFDLSDTGNFQNDFEGRRASHTRIILGKQHKPLQVVSTKLPCIPVAQEISCRAQ